MPELVEMLTELKDMVDSGELCFDDCEHLDPANVPEWLIEDGKTCPVCFVNNLFENVSFDEPGFTEETTLKQREYIQILWDRHCDSL